MKELLNHLEEADTFTMYKKYGNCHLYAEDYSYLVDMLEEDVDKYTQDVFNKNHLGEKYDYYTLYKNIRNEIIILNKEKLALKDVSIKDELVFDIYSRINWLFHKKKELLRLTEEYKTFREPITLCYTIDYEDLAYSFIKSELKFVDDILVDEYFFKLDDDAKRWLKTHGNVIKDSTDIMCISLYNNDTLIYSTTDIH